MERCRDRQRDKQRDRQRDIQRDRQTDDIQTVRKYQLSKDIFIFIDVKLDTVDSYEKSQIY